MSTGQQADEHAFQHLILTRDHPADLEERLLESLLGLRRVLGFDAARHVLSFGVASDGWVVERLRGCAEAVEFARAHGNGAARAARPSTGRTAARMGREHRKQPHRARAPTPTQDSSKWARGRHADPPRSQTTRPCYPTPGALPQSMRVDEPTPALRPLALLSKTPMS